VLDEEGEMLAVVAVDETDVAVDDAGAVDALV